MKTTLPKSCFALMVLLLLIVPTTGNAGLVLDFSDDNGVSFADDFTVQTGEGLTIGVFLRQTAPDTILNDEGIVSWGFDLTRSLSSGTLASPTVNPEFDFENHNVATAAGYELEYAQTSGVGVSGDSIPLASFEFTSLSDGTTDFEIGDRLVGAGPGNATWFTSGFVELDEQIFGTGAVDTYRFSVSSISAVPEPSSLMVLGGVFGVSILRRPRRRR